MRIEKAALNPLARQMYDDIRFNAATNPTAPLDEDTTRLFNALLRFSRESYPGQATLESIAEMTPRTIKYKDALVVVGQLTVFLAFKSGTLESQKGSPTSTPEPAKAAALAALPKSRVMAINPDATPFELTTPSEDRVALPDASSWSGVHDLERELYGPNPPKRLNADGTVPFTLEED
jgi:hypothetical protein